MDKIRFVSDDKAVVAASSIGHVVDELFDQHRNSFGGDYETYRGHVHRVVGPVALQVEIPDQLI